jgi:uncharacterized protein
MSQRSSGLALVTGASTGIGLELARLCAGQGYDLLIAADEPAVFTAAEELRKSGITVEAVETDLSTEAGVEALCTALGERTPDLLLANAGLGLGGAFLDHDLARVRRVLDTNVFGTILLVHRLGGLMRQRGSGRILVTGSIAGLVPGPFQAIYNASKAFLNSFTFALREELKGSGVTVTCLMPGVTDTPYFERAGQLDTRVARWRKMSPDFVARAGHKAMMQGRSHVVPGWSARFQSAIVNVLPATFLTGEHRKRTEPGSGLH